MKKIITLLSLLLVLFAAKAQYYFDDVESYEPFSVNPSTGPWTFVDLDSGNTYRIGGYLWDSVLEPQAFIVFNPSLTDPEFTNTTASPYSGEQYFACFRSFKRISETETVECPNNNWMISPELSGLRDVKISFYARAFQGEQEKFRIAYSTTGNDVANFTFLPATLPFVELGENEDEWTYYEYVCPAGSKYVALNNVSDNGFFFMVDDITVREVFDDNIEVFGLGVPDYSCNLTATETIEIGIVNFGNNAITSFKAFYQIGNGIPVEENVSGVNILSDSSYIYTFTTPADLTFAMDADSIRGWVEMIGDGYPANDTTDWYFTGVPAPATVPYYNDFSSDDSYKGFSVQDVNADESTWMRVDYENNPMWYYVYNADNAANDWLFSSCFDLAAGTYTLEFKYASYTYYTPEAFSVYFGTSPNPADMTLIKSFNNVVNPDFAQGSEFFTIPTAGTYYIGFKATSNANMAYLFVDEINVITARNNDLSLISATVPDYSCELTNNETIGVTLRNVGLNAISDFVAYYQVGNSTPVSESVSATIASGAEHNYTFTTPADLTIPAIDSVRTWVELTGDENTANDSSAWAYTGIVAAVDTFSYLNEFTNDEDFINWTTVDVDNDGAAWRQVTYGSDKMWYHTGASYFAGEPVANDWLYSSCFDFEEGEYTIKLEYAVYNSPTASFKIYYGTEKTTNEAQLTLIEDLTLIDNTDFVQIERAITIPQAGTYYFAWYAYEVQYYLFIDDFEVIEGNVVGINEMENNSSSVSLYPNPANNMINIQSSEEISSVQIFDMFGKTIGSYEVTGNETTIGVNKWAAGIYVAKIRTRDNNEIVKKFSIVK